MVCAAILTYVDLSLLRAGDQPFGFKQSLRFEGLGLLGERRQELGYHCAVSLCSKATKYSKMRLRGLEQADGDFDEILRSTCCKSGRDFGN